MHSLWRNKPLLTDVQLISYQDALADFASTEPTNVNIKEFFVRLLKYQPLNYIVGLRTAWRSLQWKASVWVHWVVCHSSFFRYRNLYCFSSIPTERRHSLFKMDLRHCYLGYSMSRPHLARRGLLHVVNMHALDLGLELYTLAFGKKNRWSQKAPLVDC